MSADVVAGGGDVCVEFSHFVTRLFSDGVSVKAYGSKAPMKLRGGLCSTLMAFARIIRYKISVISSDEEEDTELSSASHTSTAREFYYCSRSVRESSGNLLMASLN